MSPSYRLLPPRADVAAPTLDADQRRVVDHDGGPLLVLAGPGTGKTTTLVEAIVERVEARGADPESVLALTRTLAHAGDSVREMSDDFGLQDFEGRSYPGWHHHMTLVSAAYAYSRFHGRPAPTGGGERLLVAA